MRRTPFPEGVPAGISREGGNSSPNSVVIMETRGVSGANGGTMEIVDAEAHQRKRKRPTRKKEKVKVQKARGRRMRAWGT